MYRSQKKMWWAIALAVGLVGGVVACSEEVVPTSPDQTSAGDTQTGDGPMLVPGATLITAQCNHTNAGTALYPPNASCIEMRGSLSIATVPVVANRIPVPFSCAGWGQPGGPVDPNGWYPVPTGHTFSKSSGTFTTASTVDNNIYEFQVRGDRPTTATTVTCTIDGTPKTVTISVTGPPPALQSITNIAANPSNSIRLGTTTTYSVSTYYDDYGYANILSPAPTFTWTSSNTNVATVNPNTGVVTGVGRGTATITATSGSVSGSKSVTVKGCSAVSITPTGSLTLTGDNQVKRDVTLTCDSGIDPAVEPVEWKADDPNLITFVPDPDDVNAKWLWARGVGTTNVRACVNGSLQEICSSPISVTANSTFITTVNASGSTTLTVGNNANGSLNWSAQNTGNSTRQAIFTCTSTGAVTCTSPNPGAAVMYPGPWTFGTVTWYTGLTTGAGSITVTATGGGTRTWNFTVGSPGFSAVINGPSNVPPGANCEWTANGIGGTEPYAYSWRVGKPFPVGTDQVLNYTTGSSNFTLTVDVTDALGATATVSRPITVSSGAPACQL